MIPAAIHEGSAQRGWALLSDQQRRDAAERKRLAEDSVGSDARRRVEQCSPWLGQGQWRDHRFRGRYNHDVRAHVVATAFAVAKSNDPLIPRAERGAELCRAPSRTNADQELLSVGGAMNGDFVILSREACEGSQNTRLVAEATKFEILRRPPALRASGSLRMTRR